MTPTARRRRARWLYPAGELMLEDRAGEFRPAVLGRRFNWPLSGAGAGRKRAAEPGSRRPTLPSRLASLPLADRGSVAEVPMRSVLQALGTVNASGGRFALQSVQRIGLDRVLSAQRLIGVVLHQVKHVVHILCLNDAVAIETRSSATGGPVTMQYSSISHRRSPVNQPIAELGEPFRPALM